MVVAAIAVIAGIAFGLVSNIRSDVKAAKLRSDVESLNTAVLVYRGNGGSMDGVTTVGGVLAKLKTRAASGNLVGLKGSMADPRLEAEMLEVADEAIDTPRALWNPRTLRFEFATAGAGGAKAFYLNEDEAGKDVREEARETALAYGEMTNWVWDYADTSIETRRGVGGYETDSRSHGGYTSVTAASTTRLSAPIVSKLGGLYSYYDFDLEVELADTNPAGVATIFYSLNGAFWHIYDGGSVLVGANQTLTAYAVSADAVTYSDSEFCSEHYGSTFIISGSAGGDFLNPEGPSGMVTNLSSGQSGSFFSFGTAVETSDPSWLLFNGASFADVSAEESFLLGRIDYYNGTILSGTQANAVGLSIDLGFDGGEYSIEFDFELGLISTANLAENTDEQSADYVKLGNLYSDVPVELGGVSYNLILEFGETTTGGFSSIDEFHVVEGKAASGDLYGRLVKATDAEG